MPKTKKQIKTPQLRSVCKCVCGHEKGDHTVGGSCMGSAYLMGCEYFHNECRCKSFTHSDTCGCHLTRETM